MSNAIYGNAVLVTAFLGSLAKSVETWTDLLAVSVARGRLAALAGVMATVAALVVVAYVIVSQIPSLAPFEQQFVLGVMLLLLGMRWLRKSILRYTGVIPNRDEKATFQKGIRALRDTDNSRESEFDWFGFLTAFKIAFIDGLQVVCTAIALGYAGQAIGPAGIGAVLGAALVLGVGLLLRRPINEVPCNRLRFAVGALLSAFGTFWTAEGLGFHWPDSPVTLLVIAMTFWAAGWAAVFRGDSDKQYRAVITIKTSIP
jgi:uncharacterized membrane protein